MKKRFLASIMAAGLMLSLAGCGAKEEAAVSATETATEVETEAVTEDSVEETGAEEVTTEASASASDIPVLGGENAEGYTGFEYLYEEFLITETQENKETGEKERTTLCVYIPDNEYATANGRYAYSNSMGVDFRVELDPSMLRYDAEDYLPAENLDYYMDSQFDSFVNASCGYRDVVVTKAEEVGENAVRATVEYCKYDEWDKVYDSYFCTYYLKELENGKYVMVSVKINSADITGKATFLIEELEQFYQFDIDWDAERAEKKRLDYEANEFENTYTTGNLLFELPQGWKEDDELSSFDFRMYAPDGDFVFSGCMVGMGEEYLSYGETVDLQSLVDESAEETITTLMGIQVEEYTAEICKTNIGNAAKISCSSAMGGVVVEVVMYIVADDYNVYTLMAVQADHAIEDAIAVLEGIVTTGQTRR